MRWKEKDPIDTLSTVTRILHVGCVCVCVCVCVGVRVDAHASGFRVLVSSWVRYGISAHLVLVSMQECRHGLLRGRVFAKYLYARCSFGVCKCVRPCVVCAHERTHNAQEKRRMAQEEAMFQKKTFLNELS